MDPHVKALRLDSLQLKACQPFSLPYWRLSSHRETVVTLHCQLTPLSKFKGLRLKTLTDLAMTFGPQLLLITLSTPFGSRGGGGEHLRNEEAY